MGVGVMMEKRACVMWLTFKTWMAGQGGYVGDAEMAPAIDGGRQLETVLWVQFGCRRVSHGILGLV